MNGLIIKDTAMVNQANPVAKSEKATGTKITSVGIGLVLNSTMIAVATLIIGELFY